MAGTAEKLISLSCALSQSISRLQFGGVVTHVYNPLEYARDGWESYLELAAGGTGRIVLVGMNPGPWGMAQTGVPFGEVAAVSRWMGLRFSVGTPPRPHPKRPIEGLACARSEVSGRRLWGLMAERYGTAAEFFADHFVANYCPLVFMAETGRNITPDKLSAAERATLYDLCDNYLVQTIQTLKPDYVIGVGKFAESRIRTALAQASSRSDEDTGGTGGKDLVVGSILHPSPASPAANKGWAPVAERQLIELGAWS